MKITKSQLREIIKEEVENELSLSVVDASSYEIPGLYKYADWGFKAPTAEVGVELYGQQMKDGRTTGQRKGRFLRGAEEYQNARENWWVDNDTRRANRDSDGWAWFYPGSGHPGARADQSDGVIQQAITYSTTSPGDKRFGQEIHPAHMTPDGKSIRKDAKKYYPQFSENYTP